MFDAFQRVIVKNGKAPALQVRGFIIFGYLYKYHQIMYNIPRLNVEKLASGHSQKVRKGSIIRHLLAMTTNVVRPLAKTCQRVRITGVLKQRRLS